MFSVVEVQHMIDTIERRREQNTRATKRYRESHREKVNSISKSYYDRHKEDKEWLSQLRAKQRAYHARRKAQQKEAELLQFPTLHEI
jgi:iron-sulfur cluster repair protein YtfE (RIC family)